MDFGADAAFVFRDWTRVMPLTKKGREIERAMDKEYGSKKGIGLSWGKLGKAGEIRFFHPGRNRPAGLLRQQERRNDQGRGQKQKVSEALNVRLN